MKAAAEDHHCGIDQRQASDPIKPPGAHAYASQSGGPRHGCGVIERCWSCTCARHRHSFVGQFRPWGAGKNGWTAGIVSLVARVSQMTVGQGPWWRLWLTDRRATPSVEDS